MNDHNSLIEHLSGFVTAERLATFKTVLSQRTRHLTVVLEDIYQSHNASAVLRSCDGFGVQDVYTIENRNEFNASNEVSIGAHQWLSIQRFRQQEQNTQACIQSLRSKGYRIIATTPHEQDVEIHELDITQPTALVFGTELEGITPDMEKLADGFVKIPMYGFSESFNISVSAALCLYETTLRLRRSDIPWQLSDQEKEELLFEWLKKTIKASDRIIERYRSEH
ncbi:MAG: RNA methyltransferase [Bacteroidota bacterium]